MSIGEVFMETFSGFLALISFILPFFYVYFMWDQFNIIQCVVAYIIGIPIVFAIGFCLYFLIGYPISIYNRLISLEESIKRIIGDIAASKQKRNDTIRQLVQVVTRNISHNSDLIKYVTQAREALSHNNYDEALSSMIFISETYPYITSENSFIALNDEIATIESQIKEERLRFNREIESYNTFVREFPVNIIIKLPIYKKINLSYFKLQREATYDPNSGMFN